MALIWNAQLGQFVDDVTGAVGSNVNGYGAQALNNASANMTQMTPKPTAQISGNGLAESSWWQSLKDSFNPNGTSGRSYAGNVMDTIGTGVGIGTGLAGAYYTKKNFDLQKENQDYLKNREAQADARKATFAKNAGGGASY